MGATLLCILIDTRLSRTVKWHDLQAKDSSQAAPKEKVKYEGTPWKKAPSTVST
jgi:hypothetical protein